MSSVMCRVRISEYQHNLECSLVVWELYFEGDRVHHLVLVNWCIIGNGKQPNSKVLGSIELKSNCRGDDNLIGLSK